MKHCISSKNIVLFLATNLATKLTVTADFFSVPEITECE